MANITMSAETRQRIHDLLSQEDGNPCIRIREFRVGSG